MIVSGAADLHGHLGFQFPESGIGLIAGDFVPLYSSAENWKQWQELHWIEHKFVKWLKRQVDRCDAFFLVSGNHDIALYATDTRDEATEMIESTGATVLVDPDEAAVHEGVRIVGYPYTPTIQDRNWAFSQARTSPAARLAAESIRDCDILITHGPPQFMLDSCGSGHAGCAQLAHRILEIGPRVTFCGHVHEQRGKRLTYFDLQGRVRRIINCSIMCERYSPKGGKVQTYEL